MDNSPLDYQLFDPTVTDNGLQDQTATPSLNGPQSGDASSPGSGSTVGPAPDTGVIQPGSPLDTLINQGPLAALSAVEAFIGFVSHVVGDIESAITNVSRFHPIQTAQHLEDNLGSAVKLLSGVTGTLWQFMDDVAFKALFTSFLHDGLGVTVKDFTGEEHGAVDTVDKMLGFAFALQFIVAAVEHVGKPLLGGRWPEALAETIAKIPEEMGLSWVLGTVIEKSFDAAQGVILEEAINKQKRPNRIAWQQLRVMLKQHVIDEPTFRKLAEAQGFPHDQIDMLVNLQDVMLPVGDIQQLWYRGAVGDAEAIKLIGDLGFTEPQAGQLFGLYMAKAENEASVTYRSVARSMFVNHLLAADQYRAILVKANYPDKLIEQDITAIQLEQDAGRILTSVQVIKERFQRGITDGTAAAVELAELNYAPAYIGELLQLWQLPPLRRKHGLSQAKILSYYMSGLIKKPDARSQLVALGLNDDTVDFLLEHPSASEGVKVHARSPGLVTQAYVDGIIQDSDLESVLESAGVAKSDVAYYAGVARYRLAHKKGHAHGTLTLNEAQIREELKYGLIDFQQCVAALEGIGYTPDAALALAEITNKGPYQAPQPPAFSSVSAAIAYMQSLGYTITPPPDPRLLAAESMIASAGYGFTPPATPSGGGGGSGGILGGQNEPI